MALPEPVWGWFALGKWHSYPCIALSWLKPYEEDSMQMWLYCFQASTGTCRKVCRALWNLAVWVSTLPHALLCTFDMSQHLCGVHGPGTILQEWSHQVFAWHLCSNSTLRSFVSMWLQTCMTHLFVSIGYSWKKTFGRIKPKDRKLCDHTECKLWRVYVLHSSCIEYGITEGKLWKI